MSLQKPKKPTFESSEPSWVKKAAAHGIQIDPTQEATLDVRTDPSLKAASQFDAPKQEYTAFKTVMSAYRQDESLKLTQQKRHREMAAWQAQLKERQEQQRRVLRNAVLFAALIVGALVTWRASRSYFQRLEAAATKIHQSSERPKD